MFMDPKGTFPISIAIKGIGISCSAGFQQPFWKLIGFDPMSSGEEMTGEGGGVWREKLRRGTDNSRVRVMSSVQTQVLVTSSATVGTDHFSRLISGGSLQGVASCIEP